MIATLKTGLELIRARPGGLLTVPPAVLRGMMPMMLLAIGATALVLMYFWHDQSAYKPVFGAREKVAVSDMIAVLDAEHVPYRLHPDSGQVLVPDSQLGKVRMLLAGKGVTARLPAGLELMDRNDPLGVSQFVQDVRFRRGLEGELAQSIMALEAVDSARVHLSIAKSNSFVTGDGEKSSASVVLALKAGRTLVPEQIASIVSLVAGSVASLTPQRVSLVDQAGNLLSSRLDMTDGHFDASNQNEGARRFQDETRRNVRDLLAPVLGDDNFKTSVTAVVDNDRVEETLEKYGEAPKVTSEATREEQDRNRLAMGVPGSLSNRPVAAAPPASGPDDAGGSARKNATTRQYAYDRSITQIKHGRGALQKLSVAVVLNSAASPTPKTGWSADEIANIEKILRNGLGIDAKRGDNLVVSALAFPTPPPPVAWWQQRDNQIDIGTWVVYLVGTLLGFLLVVRPLVRGMLNFLAAPERSDRNDRADRRARPASESPAAQPGAAPALRSSTPPTASALGFAGGTGNGASNMPVVPLLENYDLPPQGSPVDVMVEHLKVLANKEPERVAEVVKQWVQKNG